MVSRDMRAHGGAILVAACVVVLASATNVPTDGGESVALAVALYGIVFGGAHLFLALRHDDGLVPVESRWRYVTALVVVLLAAGAIALAGDRPVGPMSVERLGMGAIALTAGGYLLLESAAGYRASRA